MGLHRVGEHFFVSYSTVDAADFVLKLADELVAGPPTYRVWVDKRDLRPGEDWDEQIVEALRACRGVLFVLTEDSVDPNSVCKPEWVRALKYKKPVIPLRLRPDVEVPFRLGSRQFIDFSGDFVRALAELRKHLAWTSTPEGTLEELRTLLSDARRQLPRVGPERQLLVEAEIADLKQRIELQQRLVRQPAAARKETTKRIKTELERERQPERSTSIASRPRLINPPPMTAPSYFQGRTSETALIANCLGNPGLRITTVVGRGGIGKTALVCQLLKALELGRLPDELGELTVDGIVYLSAVGAHPINFPNLFTGLCELLPDEAAGRLRQRYQDPLEAPTKLMLALLEEFYNERSVVLMDNFEEVVDTGTGAITDHALDEALRALLAAPPHGVKVVITTRVAPRELLLTQPAAQHRFNLDEGLASPHAENVLRAMDPYGSLGLKNAPADLLTRARDRTRGYPRALEALAAILAADRDTTPSELLTETARVPDNVVDALVGEAFNRLDSLAQLVIQALAVYPGPVPPVAVDYLLQPYRATIDAAPVLTRLVNMQLVRCDVGRYYLHQVDRDYALHRIPLGEPTDQSGNRTPFTRHAMWRRGADYFKQTRAPRETWKTVDDLAPQLAEFELRYQTQDYDTAASVLLDIGHDYLMRWGHCRLTLNLHQRLHGHLIDPWINAAHLNTLGSCYYRLGQINTAIEHHQQALTIARDIGDRQGEAAQLGNLGSCYYRLGQINTAIEHYQQALAIARDIGARQSEATQLGNLGNCYSHLGQINTAIEHHQQALTIARDIDARQSEATQLGNLGNCYSHLGQTDAAVEHYQLAIQIADEIGHAQTQFEVRTSLAEVYLLASDLDLCCTTAKDATAYNYPLSRAQLHLLLGIAQLRQSAHFEARQSFTTAVEHVDRLLQTCGEYYFGVECKGLALCGLALAGQPDQLTKAIDLLSKARAITTAPGLVSRTLRLLDAIAVNSTAGHLQAARSAAQGHRA